MQVSVGDTQVIINGNADVNMVRGALQESREKQMYEMRRLMMDMKSSNMLVAV
jgi:hypothetical protein